MLTKDHNNHDNGLLNKLQLIIVVLANISTFNSFLILWYFNSNIFHYHRTEHPLIFNFLIRIVKFTFSSCGGMGVWGSNPTGTHYCSVLSLRCSSNLYLTKSNQKIVKNVYLSKKYFGVRNLIWRTLPFCKYTIISTKGWQGCHKSSHTFNLVWNHRKLLILIKIHFPFFIEEMSRNSH